MAKAANGKRNQPTHAVVCSNYGQLFGTEKQCRKYYSAWSKIFPHLFSGGEDLDVFEFTSFTTTQDLAMKLIEAHDQFAQEEIMGEINNVRSPAPPKFNKENGFWAKLLGSSK